MPKRRPSAQVGVIMGAALCGAALSAVAVYWIVATDRDSSQTLEAVRAGTTEAWAFDTDELLDGIQQRLEDLEYLRQLDERRRAMDMIRPDTASLDTSAPSTSSDANRPMSPPADPGVRDQFDALIREIADLRRQLNQQRTPSPGGDEPGATGSSEPQPARARAWSPAQLAGAPNATLGTDHRNAWASGNQNDGLEWVEVDFDAEYTPAQIAIVESYRPGAVVKVEAVAHGGQYHEVWQGDDPTREPGTFTLAVYRRFPTARLRVTLDTTRVDGWNEIDAVGIVTADGETHWATTARASSTYADR